MKKIILSSIIALLVLFISSCNGYLDVNTNPNAPTATQPQLVLSGALISTASNNITFMGRYARQWCGYAAASGSYSNSGDVLRLYNLQSGSNETLWDVMFLNISNYNYVENAARGTANNDYYVAIAKIMKAWCFQNLVDNWGDIPYSNALQGFNNLSPGYDKSQAIYESINIQLDSAVQIINAAKTPVPVTAAADVMFGGNMTRWTQLANTLRLRLLLHQSQMTGRSAYITGEMAKITANKGGFLTTDAVINPGYIKSTGQQSPLWDLVGAAPDGSLSGRHYEKTTAYAVNYFVTAKDPRLPLFIKKTAAGGVYNGVPFGAAPDISIDETHSSDFGPGLLKGPTQDAQFLPAAESYFLQAEAVQRGWLTSNSDAKTLFQNGITASFVSLGLAADSAKAYYTSAIKNVNWDDPTTTDKIQAIIQQKWAAMYMTDPMEAWTDFRRLNLPAGIPASVDPAKIGPKSPFRLYYPTTEYSLNAANVNATGLTGTYQFSKLFWQN